MRKEGGKDGGKGVEKKEEEGTLSCPLLTLSMCRRKSRDEAAGRQDEVAEVVADRIGDGAFDSIRPLRSSRFNDRKISSSSCIKNQIVIAIAISKSPNGTVMPTQPLNPATDSRVDPEASTDWSAVTTSKITHQNSETTSAALVTNLWFHNSGRSSRQ